MDNAVIQRLLREWKSLCDLNSSLSSLYMVAAARPQTGDVGRFEKLLHQAHHRSLQICRRLALEIIMIASKNKSKAEEAKKPFEWAWFSTEFSVLLFGLDCGITVALWKNKSGGVRLRFGFKLDRASNNSIKLQGEESFDHTKKNYDKSCNRQENGILDGLRIPADEEKYRLVVDEHNEDEFEDQLEGSRFLPSSPIPSPSSSIEPGSEIKKSTVPIPPPLIISCPSETSSDEESAFSTPTSSKGSASFSDQDGDEPENTPPQSPHKKKVFNCSVRPNTAPPKRSHVRETQQRRTLSLVEEVLAKRSQLRKVIPGEKREKEDSVWCTLAKTL